MQQPLGDMAAIVTGAGRGIGRSIALKLAEAGAAVGLAARTESELHAVRREIEVRGGRAAVYPLDISEELPVTAAVRSAVAQFGRLDIVVNNAGIGRFGRLVDTDVEDWDRIMAVNARGPFLMCRESIPYLRQQRVSFIVNIASVVGVKGYMNQSAYSASKHALVGMTKALAREVQDDNIRVHLICPGGVNTELVTRARPDLDTSVLMEPGEIADLVLFLVSRQGNAVVDEIRVRRAASLPFD